MNDALTLTGKSSHATVYCGSMADASFDADMIASDPPWRQGNLSYWSHQAGIEQQWSKFQLAMCRHFAASIVYLKVGMPESMEWVGLLKDSGMKQIVWWETTYYAGRNAQIVATRVPVFRWPEMPDKSPSSTASVAAWAKQHGVRMVADPCVGKGEMLAKFLREGIDVVGVELVAARARHAAKLLCGKVVA